jgi:hypothetical protein
LKGNVAHGEDFVNEQDVGIHFHGDGKPEAHIHAAGIIAYGHINEIVQIRELDDGSCACGYPRVNAEDGRVEKDVFASVRSGWKPAPSSRSDEMRPVRFT